MKSIAYQPEIDGLRALAVLSVVFFHLKFNFFGGGFIGVDIFFVISGYLISSILFNEIRKNNFDFKKYTFLEFANSGCKNQIQTFLLQKNDSSPQMLPIGRLCRFFFCTPFGCVKHRGIGRPCIAFRHRKLTSRFVMLL